MSTMCETITMISRSSQTLTSTSRLALRHLDVVMPLHGDWLGR